MPRGDRLVAVVLAAAVVVGLAVAPATSAPLRRTATTLSVAVDRPQPIAGERITISGTVGGSYRRTVKVQVLTGSRWVTVRTLTGQRGSWTTAWAATAASRVRAQSSATTVGRTRLATVTSRSVAISLVPQSTTLTAPSSATTGVPMSVTVLASPTRAGRSYAVQRFRSGVWSTVASGTVGRTTTTQVTPSGSGSQRYRSLLLAWRGAKQVASSAVTVEVSPAAPVTQARLTSLQPSSGGASGGQSVTVTGEHLDQVDSLTVGGTTVTTTLSNGALVFTTPAHAPGKVTVHAGGKVDPAADDLDYTYVADKAAVSAMSPTTGNALGGDTVTLTGAVLGAVDTVRLGDKLVTPTSVTATTVVFRTPTAVPGDVPVELLDGGAVVATAPSSFTFAVPQLAPVDEVQEAAQTVTLAPADVTSSQSLPRSAYDVVLADQDRDLPAGTTIWVQPGAPGLPTGLAAKVTGTRTEDGTTVHEVRQVGLDSALSDWSYAVTAAVGDPDDPAAARLAKAASARALPVGDLGTSPVKLVNVKESFLECRKPVKDDAGDITGYEPIPQDAFDLKAQFTIKDLIVTLHDYTTDGVQHYEASVSGTPVLDVVGRLESSAKCTLAPAFLRKITRSIPVGELVLKLAPDLSVTFDAAGKVVATVTSHFIGGVRRTGEQTQWLHDFTVEPAVVSASGEVKVKTRVGMDLSLLYKGVAGLYGKVGAYGTVAARVRTESPKYCVTLDAGPELEVGARLDLLGFLTWTQPMWTWPGDPWAQQQWCLDSADDPDTSLVLDPELTGSAEGPPYTWFPDTSVTSPFPPGTFEAINSGDAYSLRTDLTLDPAKNYNVSRALVVPEGVTLTVPAGTHLKLGHCYWTIWLPPGPCLVVNGGTVRFLGTPDDQVVVTRLSDDSVDGNTDGIEESQSMSGIAPMSISSGQLVMRGVDLRWAGVSASGGTVSISGTRLSHGAGVRGSADAVLLDGVDLLDGGEVDLNAPISTLRRSQVGRSHVAFRGPAQVLDNDFTGSAVDLTSKNTSFLRNELLTDPQSGPTTVSVTPDAAAGDYRDNVTAPGGLQLRVRGATIAQDLTWDDQATYLVSDQVRVPPGVSLTLDEAVVKGGTGYNVYQQFPSGIDVAGTLVATDSTLTTLNDTTAGADTTVAAGTIGLDGTWWGGLTLQPGGDATVQGGRLSGQRTLVVPDTAHLGLADGRLSSGPGQGLQVTGVGDLELSDEQLSGTGSLVLSGTSSLTRSTVSGWSVQSVAQTVTIGDVVLDAPLGATPDGAGAQIGRVVDSTGAVLPIVVAPGSTRDDGVVQWSGGHTYLLSGSLRIPPGGRLLLFPGTVVKADRRGGFWSSDTMIYVDGELRTEGSPSDAPVVLTRRDDDRYGVPVSAPSPGIDGSRWGGVVARDGGVAYLGRVVLAGAPTGLQVDPGAVGTLDSGRVEAHSWGTPVVRSEGTLYLADLTVAGLVDGRTVGIMAGGTLWARRTRFEDLGLVVTTTDADLLKLMFTGGPGWRLRSYAPGAVSAQAAWWGDGTEPSGPAQGPIGSGAPVEVADGSSVDTEHWCTVQDCLTTHP